MCEGQVRATHAVMLNLRLVTGFGGILCQPSSYLMPGMHRERGEGEREREREREREGGREKESEREREREREQRPKSGPPIYSLQSKL